MKNKTIIKQKTNTRFTLKKNFQKTLNNINKPTILAAAATTLFFMPTNANAAKQMGDCNNGTFSWSTEKYLQSQGHKQQQLDQGEQYNNLVFSSDSRANTILAYTATAEDNIAKIKIIKRTGNIKEKIGNQWQPSKPKTLFPNANNNSWDIDIDGRTGRNDSAIKPTKIVFVSQATNITTNKTQNTVNAYQTNLEGTKTQLLKTPENATGTTISLDGQIIYVTTEKAIYKIEEGKTQKIFSADNLSSPDTTFNGAELAFQKGNSIYKINKNGKQLTKIAEGKNPQVDDGEVYRAKGLGKIRAVSYYNQGQAWKKVIGRKTESFGQTKTENIPLNSGGSTVVFGNKNYVCVQVKLIENGKLGGFQIPQGTCKTINPANQENNVSLNNPNLSSVTNVETSTRYNYIAFSCDNKTLNLFWIGDVYAGKK